MIGQNMVSQLYNAEVYDNKGEKIGSVKHVWVDNQTGAPMWASVHTGLFGMRESFVPLQSAELRDDAVRVPIEKDRVKDSPKIDASHDRITDEEQTELLQYYGFGPQRSSPENTGKRQAGQQAAGAGAGAGTQATGTGASQQATGTGAGRQAAVAGTGEQTQRAATGQQADARARTGRHADTQAGMTDARTGKHRDTEAMTRSEEQLRISTEQVETGKVRLVKHVVTEKQQVNVPVSHEEVRVEREPITAENRDAAMRGGGIAEAEQEMILHAEKPLVSKETVPVERVRLVKDVVTDTETVSDQVRKEVIDVEDDRETRPER